MVMGSPPAGRNVMLGSGITEDDVVELVLRYLLP